MSYRPIFFTSHVGKVLVKIILSRLAYYCEKNRIIPVNQAGFRKVHYTIDHLVKLTIHVKKQVAMKKSTLTTCFDVREACDIAWHARLVFKLKSIGLLEIRTIT